MTLRISFLAAFSALISRRGRARGQKRGRDEREGAARADTAPLTDDAGRRRC